MVFWVVAWQGATAIPTHCDEEAEVAMPSEEHAWSQHPGKALGVGGEEMHSAVYLRQESGQLASGRIF